MGLGKNRDNRFENHVTGGRPLLRADEFMTTSINPAPVAQAPASRIAASK